MKIRTTYVGAEARNVPAFQNHAGRKACALKTAAETIAVSKDKTLLIDVAEARCLRLTQID